MRNTVNHGSGKTRVGIVSEVRLLRECLKDRLSQEPNLSVFELGCGDASTLQHAVGADPDVILVDLPIDPACAFAEEALDRIEGTRPVVVCRSTTVEDQVRLAEAGYVGFVSSGASLDDLIRELRSAMHEESHCSPRFVGALLRSVRKRPSPPSEPPQVNALSRREREVVHLLQHRYSNKQIAAQLGIEFGTAKNHVHNVLTKLHVCNRWEVSYLAQGNEPNRNQPARNPSDRSASSR